MKILKNWQTSSGGLAGIFTAAGIILNALSDGFQSADLDVMSGQLPIIMLGISLLFARDSNKTSEDVGAK